MAIFHKTPAIYALGGLVLLALGIILGVFSLSPGQRVTATNAGTALDFDGANDYVTFGAAPGLGATNFTIETWFKQEGTSPTTSTGGGGITTAVPLVTKGRGEADPPGGGTVDTNYFLGLNCPTATTCKSAADVAEG